MAFQCTIKCWYILWSTQDNFHYTLGHLHVCQNAFWVNECWGQFSKSPRHCFSEEIGYFIVIYLDDITVYSKNYEEHLAHLRKVFEKCRKYGLSLNPKKTQFGPQEGKILGHIISKEGIKIDPKRIEGILQISHPRNIKELQYLIGKINFLRRFITNLAKLLRNITNMMKRESRVKWTKEAK